MVLVKSPAVARFRQSRFELMLPGLQALKLASIIVFRGLAPLPLQIPYQLLELLRPLLWQVELRHQSCSSVC